MGIRIIVCGGRDYSDKEFLEETLDRLHEEKVIDHMTNGGSRGADELASEWARSRGIPYRVVYAEWKKYGPSAGPKRNWRMLMEDRPDAVVAFSGGVGTANMCEQAAGELGANRVWRYTRPLREPAPS